LETIRSQFFGTHSFARIGFGCKLFWQLPTFLEENQSFGWRKSNDYLSNIMVSQSTLPWRVASMWYDVLQVQFNEISN